MILFDNDIISLHLTHCNDWSRDPSPWFYWMTKHGKPIQRTASDARRTITTSIVLSLFPKGSPPIKSYTLDQKFRLKNWFTQSTPFGTYVLVHKIIVEIVVPQAITLPISNHNYVFRKIFGMHVHHCVIAGYAHAEISTPLAFAVYIVNSYCSCFGFQDNFRTRKIALSTYELFRVACGLNVQKNLVRIFKSKVFSIASCKIKGVGRHR